MSRRIQGMIALLVAALFIGGTAVFAVPMDAGTNGGAVVLGLFSVACVIAGLSLLREPPD